METVFLADMIMNSFETDFFFFFFFLHLEIGAFNSFESFYFDCSLKAIEVLQKTLESLTALASIILQHMIIGHCSKSFFKLVKLVCVL